MLPATSTTGGRGSVRAGRGTRLARRLASVRARQTSGRIEGGVMRPAPSAGASAARCGKVSRPCHRSDRRSPDAGTASGAGRPSVRPTRGHEMRAQQALREGEAQTTGSFGNALRRLAPQLRLHGVSISFERRHEGRMIILKSERMPIASAGDARAKTESR
jgi:hypothetical protein